MNPFQIFTPPPCPSSSFSFSVSSSFRSVPAHFRHFIKKFLITFANLLLYDCNEDKKICYYEETNYAIQKHFVPEGLAAHRSK
mmetsp:Transcript_20199/g.25521  ORF Transcript_20199/g.25521 Transcript_20199/m.25521 type:complete len:83 (-) Transcript_20199:442-690(-)